MSKSDIEHKQVILNMRKGDIEHELVIPDVRKGDIEHEQFILASSIDGLDCDHPRNKH